MVSLKMSGIGTTLFSRFLLNGTWMLTRRMVKKRARLSATFIWRVESSSMVVPNNGGPGEITESGMSTITKSFSLPWKRCTVAT